MKYSISPINNKKYKIPNEISDQILIDSFINKNKNKKVVVVQGLGFVGAPSWESPIGRVGLTLGLDFLPSAMIGP